MTSSLLFLFCFHSSSLCALSSNVTYKNQCFSFFKGVGKRENANLCVLFIACRRQRDKTWNFIAQVRVTISYQNLQILQYVLTKSIFCRYFRNDMTIIASFLSQSYIIIDDAGVLPKKNSFQDMDNDPFKGYGRRLYPHRSTTVMAELLFGKIDILLGNRILQLSGQVDGRRLLGVALHPSSCNNIYGTTYDEEHAPYSDSSSSSRGSSSSQRVRFSPSFPGRFHSVNRSSFTLADRLHKLATFRHKACFIHYLYFYQKRRSMWYNSWQLLKNMKLLLLVSIPVRNVTRAARGYIRLVRLFFVV